MPNPTPLRALLLCRVGEAKGFSTQNRPLPLGNSDGAGRHRSAATRVLHRFRRIPRRWSGDMESLRLGQSHADKCRAGQLRWLNMPPGIPAEMAVEFMARIVAGETIRDLTNPRPIVDPTAPYIPPMLSADRLRRHCEQNPEWGAKVRKLSWENFKKKSRESSHLRRRTAEMCIKGLHPMTGDNVMISHKKNRQWRQCLACRRHAAKNPPMASILAIVDVIKEKIIRGTSIGEICHGKPTGGGPIDRSLVLTMHNKFSYLRKTDAEFDQFVSEHTKNNNSRGQRIRHTRVRTAAVRGDNNDYYKIRELIPESNPNRDDIVARIFEDLLGGTLKREDVPARIKGYIAELNKLYPTKYAKFGNSRLLSLDEVMFDDGSATRGDNVSRGLWD
jgi:hypothetical protein